MKATMRDAALLTIKTGLHREHSEAARLALIKASGLIGTRWQHYRNKHIYEIDGFSWSGDLDQWAIEYRREGSLFRYNRSFENAFGYADGGEVRFTEVA